MVLINDESVPEQTFENKKIYLALDEQQYLGITMHNRKGNKKQRKKNSHGSCVFLG